MVGYHRSNPNLRQSRLVFLCPTASVDHALHNVISEAVLKSFGTFNMKRFLLDVIVDAVVNVHLDVVGVVVADDVVC